VELMPNTLLAYARAAFDAAKRLFRSHPLSSQNERPGRAVPALDVAVEESEREEHRPVVFGLC
jgi:hypothetical protein